MINEEKPQLIIGDFNFCYFDEAYNSTRHFLNKENFCQLIKRPTHIDGNLLDHAYLQDMHKTLDVTTDTHSKYYTDHRGLAIMISKSGEQRTTNQ